MQHLQTDRNGLVRFAVISRTALGSNVARLDELGRFYQRCPALGVSRVFHAGGLNRVPVDLASIWPRVEGVTTFRVVYPGPPQQGDSYAAHMAREGRSDWVTCPPVLSLTHGARSSPSVALIFVRDHGAPRTLPAIAAERCSAARASSAQRGRMGDDHARPCVILVAGHRAFEHKYLDRGRCCIASVGLFHARRSLKTPPLPFGGSVVEIKLDEDGSLDYCQVTFRDMSGGMEDLRARASEQCAVSVSGEVNRGD